MQVGARPAIQLGSVARERLFKVDTVRLRVVPSGGCWTPARMLTCTHAAAAIAAHSSCEAMRPRSARLHGQTACLPGCHRRQDPIHPLPHPAGRAVLCCAVLAAAWTSPPVHSKGFVSHTSKQRNTPRRAQDLRRLMYAAPAVERDCRNLLRLQQAEACPAQFRLALVHPVTAVGSRCSGGVAARACADLGRDRVQIGRSGCNAVVAHWPC